MSSLRAVAAGLAGVVLASGCAAAGPLASPSAPPATGSSSASAGSRSPGPDGSGATAPATLDNCFTADRGSVVTVPDAGGGTLKLGIAGAGPRVVILSNESDEDLCSWLPFAARLTRRIRGSCLRLRREPAGHRGRDRGPQPARRRCPADRAHGCFRRRESLADRRVEARPGSPGRRVAVGGSRPASRHPVLALSGICAARCCWSPRSGTRTGRRTRPGSFSPHPARPRTSSPWRAPTMAPRYSPAGQGTPRCPPCWRSCTACCSDRIADWSGDL